MAKVFQIGDTVHHPMYGVGKIGTVHPQNILARYEVMFESVETDDEIWVEESMLSFTPWPAPNHERPLQDGLYEIELEGNRYKFLALRRENKFYWAIGGNASWHKPEGGQITSRIVNQRFLCECPNK